MPPVPRSNVCSIFPPPSPIYTHLYHVRFQSVVPDEKSPLEISLVAAQAIVTATSNNAINENAASFFINLII